jgi:hypothetical protein
MKKIFIALLVLVTTYSFASDCDIRIKPLSRAALGPSNPSIDFTVVGTEPDRFGTLTTWSKFSKRYIWENLNSSECEEKVEWIISQLEGLKNIEHLDYKYDGQTIVVTDKKLKCKTERVLNQNGGIFGNFARFCELTDKADPEFSVRFSRY